MVLFSREPIEFETVAYLSVCVMEKSIYVSAGGWDKRFVFYDDGVMNSQNNNNEKSADPIFNQEPGQSHKQRSACVCCPSFSFVFPPFFETITHAAKHTIITQA